GRVVGNISDHPVCASKVASQLFVDRAATPPLEEGTGSIPPQAINRPSLSPKSVPLRVRVEGLMLKRIFNGVVILCTLGALQNHAAAQARDGWVVDLEPMWMSVKGF